MTERSGWGLAFCLAGATTTLVCWSGRATAEAPGVPPANEAPNALAALVRGGSVLPHGLRLTNVEIMHAVAAALPPAEGYDDKGQRPTNKPVGSNVAAVLSRVFQPQEPVTEDTGLSWAQFKHDLRLLGVWSQ